MTVYLYAYLSRSKSGLILLGSHASGQLTHGGVGHIAGGRIAHLNGVAVVHQPLGALVPLSAAGAPQAARDRAIASSTRTEISLFIKPPNFFMLIGFNQKADKWEFVHLLSS